MTKQEQEYTITLNTYFYDDNGNYVNQQDTLVVKAHHLEWYQNNNGKPQPSGDIFYVLDIKELS